MKYDVAIIGCSLSGSVTAHLLSKSGFSVALIDKSSFPRRKACGEGLSAAGRKALEVSGILKMDDILHENLHSFCISAGRKISIPLNAPISGIARFLLDRIVFESVASSQLVNVFLGEAARSISLQNSLFQIRSDSHMINSSAVVIASGARIPKLLGISFKEIVKKRDRYGLSFHVQEGNESTRSAVTIIPSASSETYITPIGNGVENISYLGTKEDIQKIVGDLSLCNFLSSKGYAEPLDAPLGGGPFESLRRKSTTPRLRFVGDALTTLDPIGGMGMTHAILSGISEGESLISELRGSKDYRCLPLRSLSHATSFSSLALGILGSSNWLVSNPVISTSIEATGSYCLNVFSKRVLALAERALCACV